MKTKLKCIVFDVQGTELTSALKMLFVSWKIEIDSI